MKFDSGILLIRGHDRKTLRKFVSNSGSGSVSDVGSLCLAESLEVKSHNSTISVTRGDWAVFISSAAVTRTQQDT